MKNPFMSAWLSAANKAASAGRGVWAAEVKRQQAAWVKAVTAGVTGGKKTPGGSGSASARQSRSATRRG